MELVQFAGVKPADSGGTGVACEFMRTVSLCSLHVYLVFQPVCCCLSIPVYLLRHAHLRPTVTLRVDAHSATAQENTSHAVTRARMVAELVVAFTDPASFWYSGAAASLLLDGGICSVIEHQQDQLMFQQTVIDEAGAARTPVPQYAQEYRVKQVDLKIGNEPETLAVDDKLHAGTRRCGSESVGRIILAWNERCSKETSEAACVHVVDAHEKSNNPDDHESE